MAQAAKKQGEVAQQNHMMVIKKETADLVLSRVQTFQNNGELDLPPNYSAANALKSAWLMLQSVLDKNKKPALEVCTKNSIANSLLDMVVQGLNPSKKQCYFIVYGDQLTMQRSYQGTKAVCLRLNSELEDIYAEVVYEGDDLQYSIDRGRRIIEKHVQKFENIDDGKIIGAYAVALGKDGNVKRSELMTLDQLKQAWKQSKIYPITDKGDIKKDSTHGKFTGEMAKKTVTSRLSKHIIGSSSDSDLVIRSVRRTDDEAAEAEAQAEVDEYQGSGGVIDIEPEQLPQNSEQANGQTPEQTEEDLEELERFNKLFAEQRKTPGWHYAQGEIIGDEKSAKRPANDQITAWLESYDQYAASIEDGPGY